MHRPIRAGLLLSLLALFGCLGQARQWRWEHPESGYAERHRQEDIAACEQEAIDLRTNGPFRPENARPYGGWGDFDFEFCMEQRGWELVYRGAGSGPAEE